MPFQFKQFEISDEQSSMRVGTDAVLLGAWADVTDAQTILDIGTGCGIIALMLAQRNSDAQITGIDIDPYSITQSLDNFAHSPWNKRLQVFAGDFADFLPNRSQIFDVIVSNPPFFSHSLKSECPTRNVARHNDSLPFEILTKGIVRLLKVKGKAILILPVSESDSFKEKMLEAGLFCNRQTWVSHTQNHEPVRLLMEFSFENKILKENYLSIRNTGQQFTEDYRKLTQAFHPFF